MLRHKETISNLYERTYNYALSLYYQLRMHVLKKMKKEEQTVQ